MFLLKRSLPEEEFVVSVDCIPISGEELELGLIHIFSSGPKKVLAASPKSIFNPAISLPPSSPDST